MNLAFMSSNSFLHTNDEHNSSYKSSDHLERFRRQSPFAAQKLVSIPGYRSNSTNNSLSQSSSIFCPINSSVYSIKSIVISNIGSIDTATLSIPNQVQSSINTTKTHESTLVFNNPPKSQCYVFNFSSNTSAIKSNNINDIKVQFIYDATDRGKEVMKSNNTGSPNLAPIRNTNTRCGSITCKNGGSCLNMGGNKYGCRCDSSGQWLGTDCSIPNPCIRISCSNHGKCYYRTDATYYCVCSSGYSGNNCQLSTATSTIANAAIPNNPCVLKRPCFNGGTCLPKNNIRGEFTCVCPQYYTGATCQTKISSAATTLATTTSSNMCGICELKSRIDFGDRIVNGQPVYTYTWPWIVSLQIRGSHFCGGTLIDAYHVITAAHCFDSSGVSPTMYKVVAGLLNLRQAQSSNVQQLTVDRIFRHEQYSSTKLINDIAIIKLRTPARITSAVYPICLPNSNGNQDPQIGQFVQIAGWGYTNSATKQLAQQLQEANIEILNNNGNSYGGPSCNAWAQQGLSMDKTRQICAMSRDTRTDSCQGDSGGPLIRNIGTKWFLFGIVSYGDTICASSKAAGVYTRVSAYIPWIQQKIKL
ncbi:unnamed protein product [Adineta steineri]|uniref:Uncharacterized protein n=1 Tax=Adineta steineri TaxID=433720 RepID=A0A814QSA2_9BILA|nr:unnamed protein product [Adineta steineri]CAF3935611.1 unnamed protein product [Adineta steineri]